MKLLILLQVHKASGSKPQTTATMLTQEQKMEKETLKEQMCQQPRL